MNHFASKYHCLVGRSVHTVFIKHYPRLFLVSHCIKFSCPLLPVKEKHDKNPVVENSQISHHMTILTAADLSGPDISTQNTPP